MKVWKMMFLCIKVIFRFCVNFPASSKSWMHQFWRGAPLNLKPASVGLPDVKGDRSLSYGEKKHIYVVHPRLPNTLWVGIWTPKTYLKKYKISGVSWKTRVISPYPWTPSAHEKWGVLHPKISVLQLGWWRFPPAPTSWRWATSASALVCTLRRSGGTRRFQQGGPRIQLHMELSTSPISGAMGPYFTTGDGGTKFELQF